MPNNGISSTQIEAQAALQLLFSRLLSGGHGIFDPVTLGQIWIAPGIPDLAGSTPFRMPVNTAARRRSSPSSPQPKAGVWISQA